MRAYHEALAKGVDIVVDRMNPSREERQRFIAPARARGYTVRIAYFDVPAYVCAERIRARGTHPTINSSEEFRVVAGFFRKALQVPTPDECDVLEEGDPFVTNGRSLQLALHLAQEKNPWRS
jgi:predicted kinase